MAANIGHDVDRGRTADHLATGVIDPSVVEIGLGLADEVPIPARIIPNLADAQRQVDEPMLIVAPSFQNEDASPRVLAESRGEHAARRARTDHDGVVAAHRMIPVSY